jgi:hypothetical protein
MQEPLQRKSIRGVLMENESMYADSAEEVHSVSMAEGKIDANNAEEARFVSMEN